DRVWIYAFRNSSHQRIIFLVLCLALKRSDEASEGNHPPHPAQPWPPGWRRRGGRLDDRGVERRIRYHRAYVACGRRWMYEPLLRHVASRIRFHRLATLPCSPMAVGSRPDTAESVENAVARQTREAAPSQVQ